MSNAISGAGPITISSTGSGNVIFSGNNTYTNTTTVTAGGFLLNGVHSGTGLVSVANNARLGGDGSLAGDLTLAAGAKFVFNPLATLDVTGAVTLANSFGVASLVNADNTAIDWGGIADGVYTLIGTTASTFDTITNFGSANASDLGGGRSAYFQNGSLQLVIVPEPSTIMLVGLGLILVAAARLQAKPG